MNFDQAKLRAQRAANSTGKDHAVLNLNTVGSALYVVREYHASMAEGPHAHQLKFVAHPSTIDQGG